jgi:hypothetical protein
VLVSQCEIQGFKSDDYVKVIPNGVLEEFLPVRHGKSSVDFIYKFSLIGILSSLLDRVPAKLSRSGIDYCSEPQIFCV